MEVTITASLKTTSADSETRAETKRIRAELRELFDFDGNELLFSEGVYGSAKTSFLDKVGKAKNENLVQLLPIAKKLAKKFKAIVSARRAIHKDLAKSEETLDKVMADMWAGLGSKPSVGGPNMQKNVPKSPSGRISRGKGPVRKRKNRRLKG